MLFNFISTAALTLTILALGQGVVSVPQDASCGGPSDPPCPGIKRCCSLTPLNPDLGGKICLSVCPS
ncbi:hypothetical protein DFH09DRAFT_1354592 [Mycena vulgaris]|nr:hypothetical protein DFH09DRAFT_1354592 [Mycena vulgaris]